MIVFQNLYLLEKGLKPLWLLYISTCLESLMPHVKHPPEPKGSEAGVHNFKAPFSSGFKRQHAQTTNATTSQNAA